MDKSISFAATHPVGTVGSSISRVGRIPQWVGSVGLCQGDVEASRRVRVAAFSISATLNNVHRSDSQDEHMVNALPSWPVGLASCRRSKSCS